MKSIDKKVGIGILVIILLVTTIFSVYAQEEEKKKELTQEERIKRINTITDGLIADTIEIETKDDFIDWLLVDVDPIHEKRFKTEIDYRKEKGLLEKNKRLRGAIVEKAKTLGIDLKNIVAEGKRYDLSYLLDPEENIFRENIIHWEDYYGHPAVKGTGIGIGGTLVLVLIIFLVHFRRQIWMRGWRAITRKLPRELGSIFKHRLFIVKWWKKWNKTYRRFDDFFYSMKKLYLEKEKFIEKNQEKVRFLRETADRDLANLYRRQFKKFSHDWARWNLMRLEHINKGILKKIMGIVEFAEKELPLEQKILIAHIKEEAQKIKGLESEFLETESKLGLRHYKRHKLWGKIPYNAEIGFKGYVVRPDGTIETGKVEREFEVPKRISPGGRFVTTGETMKTHHDSVIGKYDETGAFIKGQLDRYIDETDKEREALEKVLDPAIKNFIRFIGQLYNFTAAEEKCIEIEAKQLEALSTGKVHSGDLRDFRDIIIHNADRKKQLFEEEKGLVSKESFAKKFGLEGLEKWFERMEEIKKKRISYVEEQMRRRHDQGKSILPADKPLPVKGIGIPEINDIMELHDTVKEGKLDKLLEEGVYFVKEKGKPTALVGPAGQPIKVEAEEEEVRKELEKGGRGKDIFIDILADWVEEDLHYKELADKIRKSKDIEKWKERKKKIISDIETTYPALYGVYY